MTEESLRNASGLFQEPRTGEAGTKGQTVAVEDKTRSFTGQASHASVFQTAGKKSSIRVPDDLIARATALLDEDSPRLVEQQRNQCKRLLRPM